MTNRPTLMSIPGALDDGSDTSWFVTTGRSSKFVGNGERAYRRAESLVKASIAAALGYINMCHGCGRGDCAALSLSGISPNGGTADAAWARAEADCWKEIALSAEAEIAAAGALRQVDANASSTTDRERIDSAELPPHGR